MSNTKFTEKLAKIVRKLFSSNSNRDKTSRICVSEEVWNAAVLDLQADSNKTIVFTIHGGRELRATKFISGDKNSITWESRSGEHTTNRKGVVGVKIIDRRYCGTVSRWCGTFGFLRSDEGVDYHFFSNNVCREVLDELENNVVGQRVIFYVLRRGNLGRLPSVKIEGRVQDDPFLPSEKAKYKYAPSDGHALMSEKQQVNVGDNGDGKVTAWYCDRGYGFVQGKDGFGGVQYYFVDLQSVKDDDTLMGQLKNGEVGQHVDYVVNSVGNGKYPRVTIRLSNKKLVLPTGDSEYSEAKKAALSGRISTAISAYKELLKNPNGEDFLSAVKDLAEIYNRTDPDAAVRHVDMYRPMVPVDVQLQLDRMKLIYLLHANRTTEARELTEKLLKEPGNPPNRIKHYEKVIANLTSATNHVFNPLQIAPFERHIRDQYEKKVGSIGHARFSELRMEELNLHADAKKRGDQADGYVDENYNAKMILCLYYQIAILQKEDDDEGPADRDKVLKSALRKYFFRKAMELLAGGHNAAGIAYLVMALRRSKVPSHNETVAKMVLIDCATGDSRDCMIKTFSLGEETLKSSLENRIGRISPEGLSTLQSIVEAYGLSYLLSDVANISPKSASGYEQIRDDVRKFLDEKPDRLSDIWIDGIRAAIGRLSKSNPLEGRSAAGKFEDMLNITADFVKNIDYPTRRKRFEEFTKAYEDFVRDYIDNDRGLTLYTADVYYPVLEKIYQEMDRWLNKVIKGQLSFELEHEDGSDYLLCEDGASVRLAFKLKSLNRTAPTVISIRLCVSAKSSAEDSIGEEIFADACSLKGGDEIKIGGSFTVPQSVLSDPDRACDLLVDMECSLEGYSEARQQSFRSIMTVVERKNAWKNISNPYRLWAGGKSCSGDKSEECFVGRQEILDEMESTFGKTDGGQCYVLYGQRRVGKTSLYDNLKTKLGCERYVYVQIPAQTKFDFGKDYRAAFARAIAEDDGVKAVAGEAVCGKIPDPSVDSVGAVETLCRMLHSAGKILVIGIDEFTTVYEDYLDLAKGKSDESVARHKLEGFIAMLKQNLDAGLYHLLLIGRPSMERFKDEFGVELAAMDNMRQFWGLDDKAVRRLVYDKLVSGEGRSMFRGKAYDLFDELTGGSPYLIHKFCACLVDYLNKNRYPIIGEAQIETVADMLCKQGPRCLSIGEFKQWYVFKDPSVSDNEVLEFEFAAADMTNGGYGRERNELIGSGGKYEKAFELAVKWRVIEQIPGTERYKFAVGLYERWLCANRSLARR